MKPLHLLLSVVAVACLAAVPLGVTNTYYLHLIETIMIYAILLFGLDIVVGYTGRSRWAMPACSASAPTWPACCSSICSCPSG